MISCVPDFRRLQKNVNLISAVAMRICIATCCSFFVACSGHARTDSDAHAVRAPAAAACTRSHTIIARHPHDPTHFTQGLLIADGRLFESTGLYGRSAIFEKELRSGRVLRSRTLPDAAFGEGLALVGRWLVQLTWREGAALVYDLQLGTPRVLAFDGEGWGLTQASTADGPRLLATDGSHWLRVLDQETLREIGRIAVRDSGQRVPLLNELEAVGTEVLANIWHSTRVVAIDPLSGAVRGAYDFADLLNHFDPPPGWNGAEDVLNGMAFDPASGHLFVTGKRWPALFELRLGDCAVPSDARGN